MNINENAIIRVLKDSFVYLGWFASSYYLKITWTYVRSLRSSLPLVCFCTYFGVPPPFRVCVLFELLLCPITSCGNSFWIVTLCIQINLKNSSLARTLIDFCMPIRMVDSCRLHWDARIRDLTITSSFSWLVNAWFLPNKATILVGRENVLTNHDKDDVTLCHVF